MSNINQLARDFHELEEQLVTCIRCGMCQSVCPVFEQTRKEADVARGKLALLNGMMSRMFEDPQGVSNRLNKCLLCGSCAANCPSGVNALEIFIRARTLLTGYLGLSTTKKLIFKQMLTRPAFFNTLMSFAQKFQPLITKKQNKSIGTSCARFNMPLVGHRNFIPLSDSPFHKSKESKRFTVKKANASKPTIAFFTGCLIDKMLPQIAHAAVKVFTHHNIDIIVPPNQGCCGIPALASGDKDTFEKLIRYHLDLFDSSGFDYLITACATCTSTIKKLWPVFSEDKTRACRLSDKTMDINQFLVDVMHIENQVKAGNDNRRKVTYHDPCHLKKSLGIFSQPRELIRQSGFELVEMAGADKCCGMGGSFNLHHYDLSSRIGTLKQESIVQSNCHMVATGCPACIVQISDMLSKADVSVPVRHPIELYADTI